MLCSQRRRISTQSAKTRYRKSVCLPAFWLWRMYSFLKSSACQSTTVFIKNALSKSAWEKFTFIHKGHVQGSAHKKQSVGSNLGFFHRDGRKEYGSCLLKYYAEMCGLTTCFVHKVLLQLSHAHLLTYCQWLILRQGCNVTKTIWHTELQIFTLSGSFNSSHY